MRKVLVATVAVIALLGGCANNTGNSGGSAASTRSSEQAKMDQAVAAIRGRNYAEAESILSGILKNNPNDPYANLAMGAVKAISDDKAAARQYYQVAIRNGENASLQQTITANGAAKTVNTTVAAVARQNVSRL